MFTLIWLLMLANHTDTPNTTDTTNITDTPHTTDTQKNTNLYTLRKKSICFASCLYYDVSEVATRACLSVLKRPQEAFQISSLPLGPIKFQKWLIKVYNPAKCLVASQGAIWGLGLGLVGPRCVLLDFNIGPAKQDMRRRQSLKHQQKLMKNLNI